MNGAVKRLRPKVMTVTTMLAATITGGVTGNPEFSICSAFRIPH